MAKGIKVKKEIVVIEDEASKEIEKKILTLEDVTKALNKKFGKSSSDDKDSATKRISPIISVASKAPYSHISRIRSGVLAFDFATYGGIPKGRISEFYGMESSSKTTMALRVIGQAQREGLLAAFVDVEGTFDAKWANRFVNLDNMLLSKPETGEEALEIVESLIRSGSVDLIVLDSVAAMTPSVEIEKGYGDVLVGVHAKLMNSAMRKWVSAMTYTAQNHSTEVAVILINQIRMKIGVMFGNPEELPGGMGQRFAKSLSAKFWRGKEIIDDSSKKPIMVDMNFRITKSKVSPPFIAGAYTMMLRDTDKKMMGGIYDEAQLQKLVKKYDYVKKEGGDTKLILTDGVEMNMGGIGVNDIGQWLLDNPIETELLRKDMLSFLIEL